MTASERFLLADGTRPLLSLVHKPYLFDASGDYCSNTGAHKSSELYKSLLLVVGLPSSTTVGLGAVLGTLKSNAPLASYIQPAFLTSIYQNDNKDNVIDSLLQNSEEVLWNMTRKHTVHVNELYSKECNQP
uniref:Uncharacterized protein n=1 Tax=Lygus hesperus TaxID=30085 RepID=A0A146LN77_LYGHE